MFDEDYGVQSYFGESGDCDFFGDTSMSGGFASGMGEAGFVSEAFAQEDVGGSFFTEASEFDTMGGEFFTEAEGGITYAGTPALKPEDNPVLKERAKLRRNSTGGRFGDMTEASSKASIDSEDKRYDDYRRKTGQTPGTSTSAKNNSTHIAPRDVETRRHATARYRDSLQRRGADDYRLHMDRDTYEAVDRAYEASKRHGREIGKHMENK